MCACHGFSSRSVSRIPAVCHMIRQSILPGGCQLGAVITPVPLWQNSIYSVLSLSLPFFVSFFPSLLTDPYRRSISTFSGQIGSVLFPTAFKRLVCCVCVRERGKAHYAHSRRFLLSSERGEEETRGSIGIIHELYFSISALATSPCKPNWIFACKRQRIFY